MHYKHKENGTYSVLPPKGNQGIKPLYQDKAGNTMLNEFGIHVIDQLHTLQNMGSLKMQEDKDLLKFISSKYPAIGTGGRASVGETYVSSKELIAYADTLIFVSPFYRQDDHRNVSKLEEQFQYTVPP